MPSQAAREFGASPKARQAGKEEEGGNIFNGFNGPSREETPRFKESCLMRAPIGVALRLSVSWASERARTGHPTLATPGYAAPPTSHLAPRPMPQQPVLRLPVNPKRASDSQEQRRKTAEASGRRAQSDWGKRQGGKRAWRSWHARLE